MCVIERLGFTKRDICKETIHMYVIDRLGNMDKDIYKKIIRMYVIDRLGYMDRDICKETHTYACHREICMYGKRQI